MSRSRYRGGGRDGNDCLTFGPCFVGLGHRFQPVALSPVPNAITSTPLGLGLLGTEVHLRLTPPPLPTPLSSPSSSPFCIRFGRIWADISNPATPPPHIPTLCQKRAYSRCSTACSAPPTYRSTWQQQGGQEEVTICTLP